MVINFYSMSNKKFTEKEFIIKAKMVQGDKYDYSKVIYKNIKTHICIICPEHGEFWQTPDMHLRGRGCPICGRLKCRKTQKKWDEENIITEAHKYRTQVEFKRQSGGAYTAARRMGLIKVLNQHWEKYSMPRNFWQYDTCKDKAKECANRSEFWKKFAAGYHKSLKEGWIDEFFPSNERNSKEPIHCVYGYIDPINKVAYIGRTLMRRIEKRDYEHRINEKDSVYSYFRKNELTIPEITIIEKNLNCNESLIKEDEYIKQYKKSGYIIINKAKTGIKSGSIGAISFGKLSKEYCFNIAKKCRTKHEFNSMDKSAYSKACKMGWMKEYVWFEEVHKPKGYWNNYDHCYSEFVKCGKDIARLRKENSTCYKYAVKNGFTGGWHKKRVAPNKKWTEASLKKIVKKYPSRTALQKNQGGAYNALRKTGLLYKYYLPQNDKPFGYWNNFENVKVIASQYISKWDFGKNERSAYNAALRNKWMDILFPKKIKTIFFLR